MSERESRMYTRSIEYVKDFPGGDVERDIINVDLAEQSKSPIHVSTLRSDRLGVDISEIGGKPQSAVDVAAAIENITKALHGVGGDELVVRLVDSSGDEVDPATVALDGALKSNNEDELVSRVVDSSGSEIDPATVALEEALKSNDNDELVSRIVDTSGSEIDPATDAIEDALSSNGDDDIRVDTQAGEINRLKDKVQYTFSDRYEDVADDDTVFDILVSNPSDSEVDIVFSPSFLPGGLAHLDVSEDITVDTSGDSMDYLAADVMSGESPELDVEEGGSYTVEGDTIRTVLQGTNRVGGPSSTSGAKSPIITAKLISPGESVLYSATNKSGGEVTYAAEIGAIEL